LNAAHVVERWDEIRKATGCGPLPPELTAVPADELAGDPGAAQAVLEHAIRASARWGLLTTSIGHQVILREMQRCMNDKELPTGGLSFDADHAAALVRHEVFVTFDAGLAASLKTIAAQIDKDTKGQWRPVVVTNAKQLESALTKPRT
jgi:hypothetical protein